MSTSRPAPDWIRLRPIAHLLGLTPRLFEADCLEGRAPVRVQFFGRKGIAHVNRLDAERFRAQLQATKGTAT